MAKCTAPYQGHRTESGRAACPACSGGFSSYRPFSSYAATYVSRPTASPSNSDGTAVMGGSKTSSSTSKNVRARWSKPNSLLFYSEGEIRTLTPVRERVEDRAATLDLRDVFLCHAWDDRGGSAKELHDRLEDHGVKVWFSEKDVQLGSGLLREIDKGLAKSRIGIVLVTPALIQRLKNEGIADKELSALLARDLLVPIVHGTTFEALREVSPLLGSRSGLSTNEDTMLNIAAKIAELVDV